jgi:integrase
VKLTNSIVRGLSLPEGKVDKIIFDSDVPGLGVRLREKSRSFIFQYQVGRRTRRMNLGAASALDLADVRKVAGRLYAEVRLGGDPAKTAAVAKAEAAQAFDVVVRQYLISLLDPHRRGGPYRQRAYVEVERHLTKHSASLNALAVAKITQHDVAGVVTRTTANSGAVTGNRVRASLSGLFSWALRRGLAPANPTIHVDKNEEKSRDRVLLPAELRLVWSALDEDDAYSDIVRLLMLLGLRRAEVGGLRRSEVYGGLIVLEPDRTKGGRRHAVPLSQPAINILDRRLALGGEFLFGRGGQGAFGGWSVCKMSLDARVTAANGGVPIPGWTIHDLRRVLASYVGGGLEEHHLAALPKSDRDLAGGLGVPPHVVEALLGHVGSLAGVAGVYARTGFEGEKREALNRWASRLGEIVTPRAEV